MTSSNICVVYDLGTVDYPRALELQQCLALARLEGKAPNTLLLLEHPSVVTVGRSGSMDEVAASVDSLARNSIAVLPTDRGGRVTYHGPGQLVAYPIIDLGQRAMTVTDYVRGLEQTVIDLLASWGIAAGRSTGYPGVWVEEEKICSLGVHISRRITRHGFALNVDPDLGHFGLIRPCGITDRGVTSMARLLGRRVEIREVKGSLKVCFSRTFGLNLQERDLEGLWPI
ncbi:MAG: lipoyl(octanoyl) transferase LipB [Dehalococcoidia bacterium]|jgi:lipoate-protein ligase B|nr:lipoyl(octanoyl) transferase LipB [Dehalococcoidia bacterium]